MPELPEVETVVRELRLQLKNKIIKTVRVLQPKMVAMGPSTLSNRRRPGEKVAAEFSRILRGQKILGLSRRAKMIIIDLSGKFTILVHLKMTGQLIYLDRKHLAQKIRLLNTATSPLVTLPARPTHVILEFTDGSKLFYNDYRQFGYLKLVTDKELPQVPELQDYGPEPLDKKFTNQIFAAILAHRANMRVKVFLLDQTLIAGIGNIYSDEILFFAKVRPVRRVKSLTSKEKTQLFQGIKVVLTDALKHHGSSVWEFVRPNGEWGTYGRSHKVYGRAGEKCLVCGSVIKSIKFNGRTSSYCGFCQK